MNPGCRFQRKGSGSFSVPRSTGVMGSLWENRLHVYAETFIIIIIKGWEELGRNEK